MEAGRDIRKPLHLREHDCKAWTESKGAQGAGLQEKNPVVHLLDFGFWSLHWIKPYQAWVWVLALLLTSCDPTEQMFQPLRISFLILGGEGWEQTISRCFPFLRPLSTCFYWLEVSEAGIQVPYFCYWVFKRIHLCVVFQIYVNSSKVLHF